MARLQDGPIAPAELLAAVGSEKDGAAVLFVGTVRGETGGRRVVGIEYEAYGPMAETEMSRIEREALERFAVSRVLIVHRTGRLAVGEASVAVAAAAPHRAEAFEACRFAMDAVKRAAPIWKKELFEDGAVWVEGDSRTPAA